MKKRTRILAVAAAALLAASCVSTQKYNSMKAEAMRAGNDLEWSRKRIEELSERNSRLQAERDELARDTARLGADYRRMTVIMGDASEDAARMLAELQRTQDDLNRRTQRIEELERLLKARDEAISTIRRKVADALLGFEGKGLTVTTKDGKVYVSMDDKLLFSSGSFEIDPNGARAVRELGDVLAANPDICVMVEGHTDDVPYNGSGQLKDNLDLSAKRATTVVRLLLANDGIAPDRIIAAGRGESLPIDSSKTAEGRARNRRTEIILTPKFDELLEVMDKM